MMWKHALQPCSVALVFFDLGKWQECVEQSQSSHFLLQTNEKGNLPEFLTGFRDIFFKKKEREKNI